MPKTNEVAPKGAGTAKRETLDELIASLDTPEVWYISVFEDGKLNEMLKFRNYDEFRNKVVEFSKLGKVRKDGETKVNVNI